MIILEVGRGSVSSAAAAAAAAASKEEMLRASKDLTLGLEPSSSGSFASRISRHSQQPQMFHPQPLAQRPYAPPFELDLWPRQQSAAVPTHSQPDHRRFSHNSSSINDCQEIAPAETHSSSRSRSPSAPRGIDMNEIPPSEAEAAAAAAVMSVRAPSSSPRRSMSPPSAAAPSGAFPFEIARRGESSVSIKRERERTSGADADPDRACEVSSRGSDEEDGAPRKKLRLTKEQSALLEESFKEHSTLNPKQKTALAKELNLRPRQVEVWFQNRRARTKLKQTEIDCEVLKRVCETLTEDNRRLLKEVQELRAIKAPPPCVISQDFYMPLPAATLTMCPSCERVATVDGRSPISFSASKATASHHNFAAAAAAAAHHHHQSAAAAAACRS